MIFRERIRRIAVIFTVLLIVLTISYTNVSAVQITASDNVAVDIPDRYTVIQNSSQSLSDNANFIKTLGHSQGSLQKFMDNNGVLMLAATIDNKSQIQIKNWTTDFSTEAGNLALFADNESALSEAIAAFSLGSDKEIVKSVNHITVNGTLFIAVEKVIKATKNYSCMQYTTITDGQYNSLLYYNFGGEFTENERVEAQTVFNSLTISVKNPVNANSGKSLLNIVLLWVAIGIMTIFIIVVTVSLVREALRRRAERNGGSDKIIRRKMK